MSRTVCGIGINDADYHVQKFEWYGRVNGKSNHKLVWLCPYYNTWKNMITRCCRPDRHIKFPRYKDAVVCDEWLYFMNFRKWMVDQPWEGNHLDKDILHFGNKIYSPSNCVFISPLTNTFILECNSRKGEFPIGVTWDKNKNKFTAQCQNPFEKKRGHIGYFDCPDEAHSAWLEQKLTYAKILASQQEDCRVATALVYRYENYYSLNLDAKKAQENGAGVEDMHTAEVVPMSSRLKLTYDADESDE